jgi:hypothetical protein
MILIPKIVHFIWIGPDPCPYEENINSYRLYNPDWDIKLWDNDNLPEIFNKWLYDKMTSWAGKADVLRLEILYNHGGLYVDVDSKCLKPLDTLVDGLECFGMQGNGGGVNNCTMGCIPKHPAFQKIVFNLEDHAKRLAETSKNKKKGTHLFNIAGTRYVTPYLRDDPTFIQIDKDCKPGERKYIGTREDWAVVKDGYIVQFHDGSWVKSKQKRIKL